MQTTITATLMAAVALLTAGSASASIANAQLGYSNLQFRVLDLTPGDGVAAGFTLTGGSSSIYFRVLDGYETETAEQLKTFPTSSAPVTSWTNAGKTFAAWSGNNTASASVGIDSFTSQDGSGWVELVSRWTFELAPGTALLVSGTAETTLTRDSGPMESELGANSFFRASGSLSPTLQYEYQWAAWDWERHTSWAQEGTAEKNFSLALLNGGPTVRQGELALTAKTDAYAYLGVAPPVPEPATWLMLGAGLLLTGAAARRWRS